MIVAARSGELLVDEMSDTIAAWVREALDPLGTQENQAEALGAHQSLVNRWRRGIKEPSLRTLLLIARRSGASLAELGRRLDNLAENVGGPG